MGFGRRAPPGSRCAIWRRCAAEVRSGGSRWHRRARRMAQPTLRRRFSVVYSIVGGSRGLPPGCPVPSQGMRLLSPTDVRGLLAAHDLRPSRALGQNFLADPNTARRIVRPAGVGPGDRVLEVGPGIGSLTVALAEAVMPGGEVVALELDRHLLPVLAEVVADLPQVRVVQGDALTADYGLLLEATPADDGGAGGTWTMVSNLPYNAA